MTHADDCPVFWWFLNMSASVACIYVQICESVFKPWLANSCNVYTIHKERLEVSSSLWVRLIRHEDVSYFPIWECMMMADAQHSNFLTSRKYFQVIIIYLLEAINWCCRQVNRTKAPLCYSANLWFWGNCLHSSLRSFSIYADKQLTRQTVCRSNFVRGQEFSDVQAAPRYSKPLSLKLSSQA